MWRRLALGISFSFSWRCCCSVSGRLSVTDIPAALATVITAVATACTSTTSTPAAASAAATAAAAAPSTPPRSASVLLFSAFLIYFTATIFLVLFLGGVSMLMFIATKNFAPLRLPFTMLLVHIRGRHGVWL